LPIGLSSFKGDCDSIKWITSEIPNGDFILENSIDAINWNTVKIIKSTEKKNYSEPTKTLNRVTYFRLKQQLDNNNIEISDIIAVTCNHKIKRKLLGVYTILGQYLGNQEPNVPGVYLFKYSDGVEKQIVK
jgi:hypothetical protein